MGGLPPCIALLGWERRAPVLPQELEQPPALWDEGEPGCVSHSVFFVLFFVFATLAEKVPPLPSVCSSSFISS